MILGAGAAVLMRVVFTAIVATLMALPYLKLIGGLALLVIAAKLLVPDKHEGNGDIKVAASLAGAIQIIVVADVVMSLDNVIAIAAAARGNTALLIFGLAVSIPLIIAGAAMIMAVLTRLPALVWAGAGLLGWIAGHVIATDRRCARCWRGFSTDRCADDRTRALAAFSAPYPVRDGADRTRVRCTRDRHRPRRRPGVAPPQAGTSLGARGRWTPVRPGLVAATHEAAATTVPTPTFAVSLPLPDRIASDHSRRDQRIVGTAGRFRPANDALDAGAAACDQAARPE